MSPLRLPVLLPVSLPVSLPRALLDKCQANKATGVGAFWAFTADPLIGGARHEGAIRPMFGRPRDTLAHVPFACYWGLMVVLKVIDLH